MFTLTGQGGSSLGTRWQANPRPCRGQADPGRQEDGTTAGSGKVMH